MDEISLTPEAPLWAWAAQAIAERAGEMFRHVHGVRLGEDIEAVHDMRVWSRRLVAAMRVFAPCFPGAEFRRLLRESRGVTQALGSVRDLDVLLDHYRRLQPELEGAERLASGYLIGLLDRRRDVERGPMLAALARMEKSSYERRLVRFMRDEAASRHLGLAVAPACFLAGEPCDGHVSFLAAAPKLIGSRLREMLAFEEHVYRPDAVTELHEMRIKAKWLRYTLELFLPIEADRMKDDLAAVKTLQERLGDLHDSDVRLDLLADVLRRRLDLGQLERLGLYTPEPVRSGLRALEVRERATRRGCYEAFLKDWNRIKRRRQLERLQQWCGPAPVSPVGRIRV